MARVLAVRKDGDDDGGLNQGALFFFLYFYSDPLAPWWVVEYRLTVGGGDKRETKPLNENNLAGTWTGRMRRLAGQARYLVAPVGPGKIQRYNE